MELPVSIIITNYNYGRFLRSAIESALSQTDAPLEVIVVDDGSTDGTPERVLALGDSRIRLAANGRHTGRTRCLNQGVGMARSELVAIMDGATVQVNAAFSVSPAPGQSMRPTSPLR